MPVSRVAITVFLVLLLFTSYLLVELFWVFVTPIVLALVLVSIFHSLYGRILMLCHGHKHFSAAITILIIMLLVSIPFSFFIATLSGQALQLYNDGATSNFFASYFNNFSSQHPLVARLHDLASSFGLEVSAERLVAGITQLVSSFGRMLYDHISELASNALSIAFNFIVTMLLVYTFFVTGGDLKQYLMDLSPLPHDEKERLVRQFSEISRAVFVSNGFVSVAEGCLGGLAFYFFNLGPALFWGVAIALSAFLPVVGVWIIVGPATLILLAEGQTTAAIGYFLFNTAYLVTLELIIKPRLIGGKNRLHVVLVLLSVLGGIKLFGVLGLFYGPLVVTMFMSLIEIYKEHYREHLLRLNAIDKV